MLRRTKLLRPAVPHDLVMRSRLFDRLNEGLSRPLTLISAPAGYGKTMLASSFVQRSALPWAWLSLDEQDNDLGLFVQYVLAAIDTVFPGALTRTQQFVGGSTLPPVSAIADRLINDITDVACEFIFVLDDVHLIREVVIYDLLTALLRHPVREMHLLLLTRQDPPLGLGVLRARDQVSEIRTRDLRFTAEETAAFMDGAVSTHLSDDTLVLLAERTEGWVVGLRLAALTLRYGGAIDPQVAVSNATDRYVNDFLFSEVLSHVPSDVENFLLKTSILDTLCGPLCDAVMGADSTTGHGQSLLQMLEATNLFTVALDEQRQSYRYHHLFQLLLHSELMRRFDAEVIDALHQRASAWYASYDSLDLALKHALAGNDVPGAVQLVVRHRHDLLNAEQRPQLERWLRLLPAATLSHYPELLLIRAWAAELDRSDAHTVLATVDQAQALVDQIVGQPGRVRELQAEIDTMRSIDRSFAATDPQGVITLTTNALATMPPEWAMARTVARMHLAGAYQMSGQLDRAYAVFEVAEQEKIAYGSESYVRHLASLCFIHWIAADLPVVLRVAQQAVSVGQATERQPESVGWGHTLLAASYYQQNDLAAAELHANSVLEMRHASQRNAVIQGAIILAATQQARGRPDAALRTLAHVSDYLAEIQRESLLPLVQACRAELAARQGDLASAEHWATTVDLQAPFRLMAFPYAPLLSLPRVLLRINTPPSRQQAAALLTRLHTFLMATHNTRHTIDVLALQALYYDAEGDASSALQALEQAVALAEPGGFIRVFVDLGPVMAGLLERLAQRGCSPTYIRQILNAFAATPAPAEHPRPPSGWTVSQSDLVEPLTSRELDVLELLAERLSAKEIAQRLTITERTVSRHTANIYQKLAVNNRREAIGMATKLDILPAR